jgi:signal transduction histidine kinase/CheY-like chemotaxis protein
MADEYARGAPARRLKQALSAILITQNLRYWLVAIWGSALCVATDWRTAAIWCAATSIAALARGEFERRLARGAFEHPVTALTAAAAANSLIWAVAPILAWNTGQIWSQMIAVAMLMAAFLMVFTQFGHMLRQALIANAPYTAVAVWFALHMQKTGEFWPFMACVLVIGGSMHANVQFWRVHRRMIERYQNRQATLIGELELARDRANAANAAKSAFLAMISHELRTPMNGVLGAAQLLDGAGLTRAQKRYVEMIRTSGDGLLGLLNDILDFARIESGHIELEAIAFDLPDLIRQAAAIWSAKADGKGLDFQTVIAPETPATVVGDPARLSQIVHNLLSNAIKFTDEGHVVLEVGAERLESGRARISVTVSDSGIGIPAADRARLFQPFFQLDSSSTRRFGGAGLGLAISRRLAELSGGRMEVDSEPGRGSRFALVLDLDVTEWGRRGAAPAAGTLADRPSGRPLRILVADDHATGRKLILLWLELEGHAFTAADNGRAALEICAGQAFDLILMDADMPVMDGPSAVRALRAGAGVNQRTPVVMLSASARAEDHDAGLRAGADAWLTKPIDFNALRTMLAQFAAPASGHEDSAAA